MPKMLKILLATLLAIIIFLSVFLLVNHKLPPINKSLNNNLCKVDIKQVKELYYLAPGYHNVEKPIYIGVKTDRTIKTGEDFYDQLFMADQNLDCDSVKIIYSIQGPGEDAFYTPAINLTFKYILVQHGIDFILLDMDGKIISDSVLINSAQEIAKKWYAVSIFKGIKDGSSGNDNSIHLILENIFTSKNAVVQLDMKTGKININSLEEL